MFYDPRETREKGPRKGGERQASAQNSDESMAMASLHRFDSLFGAELMQ